MAIISYIILIKWACSYNTIGVNIIVIWEIFVFKMCGNYLRQKNFIALGRVWKFKSCLINYYVYWKWFVCLFFVVFRDYENSQTMVCLYILYSGLFLLSASFVIFVVSPVVMKSPIPKIGVYIQSWSCVHGAGTH